MNSLKEKELNSKLVFDGNLLKVYSNTVELPNGKEAGREYIKHPGAVAIVPITQDGKIILVRQYRYPTGKALLEIPAGKLDKGEKPVNCALRELEEETGYVAKTIQFLSSIYTTPGFTDEIIHLYVAEGLTFVKQNLDEDEFLNVEIYTKQEVKKMILDGRINDGKSMLALLLAGV